MTMIEKAKISDLTENGRNVRKTGRDDGIAALAASIERYGVILPLAVDSAMTVIDGGRRLRALQQLVEAGKLKASDEVPVIVHADGADVGMSLAANINTVPLHPVDQYEAFASLVETMTEKEIASAFALKPKQVRQVLALGRLSPKVRQAWREGLIDEDAAQAFTLADHKRQDAVFDEMRKQRSLWSGSIRQAIVGDDRDSGRMLAFVGAKDYEKMGGEVRKDLFGDDDTVSDLPLLKEMADAKLAAQCTRLVKAGWSWAEVTPAQDHSRWGWKRERGTGEEGDQFTDAQKKRSGCFVSLGWEGEATTEGGFVRPKDEAPAKPGDKAKPEKQKEPSISNALAQRLSEQLTEAVEACLAEHPAVALAAAAAALQHGSGPLKLQERGLSTKRQGMTAVRGSFASTLKGLLDSGKANVERMLAVHVAKSADLQTFNAQASPLGDKNTAALVDALPAKAMKKALADAFDAEDYFASASKTMCVLAIEDCFDEKKSNDLARKPKADVAKFATANCPKKGWLPPELRTSAYDGPGKFRKNPTRKN